MNCSKYVVDLERAKDAVIEAARKLDQTHYDPTCGCERCRGLSGALAALDKLEKNNRP